MKKNNKNAEHDFPYLDTVNNIFCVKCVSRVGNLLCNYLKSFSQGDNKESNFITIVHHCLPQNKMTHDAYYIVKNIIYSILNKCPEVLAFFKLLDLDINKDIFYNDSETLKLDYTEIFIKFVKKLRELKLDYNIVIVISQVDSCYNKNNLHNFIFLLRNALRFAPPYLKFVMTLTGDSIIDLDEISRILLLKNNPEAGQINDISLSNRDLFSKYSNRCYRLLSIELLTSSEELSQKCEGDFDRLLDAVEMLCIMRSMPSQSGKSSESSIFAELECNMSLYINSLKLKSQFKDKFEDALSILLVLKMPISSQLLAKILSMEESSLLKLVQNDLKTLVFCFKKRTKSKVKEDEEEKKAISDYDDYYDNIYIAIRSVELWINENNVEIHNEIVRVLRKQQYDHYCLYCLWYHISECDEDYTKDYIEETDKIMPTSQSKDDILDDDVEEKSKSVTFFDIYTNQFKITSIFKFIEYHRAFEFLINELGSILCSHQTDIIEKERSQLLNFRNVLYLIEHTIKFEKLSYPDFCTQLRGRLIGEKEKSLMYKLRLDITNQKNTYFKGFQNSLRENAKIETIMKFPFSTNKTCLFPDQRRVAVFGNSGLVYICSADHEVLNILSNEYPEIECVQFISLQSAIAEDGAEDDIEEEEYIFTAGNDPYLRKWDLAIQREVAHYQCHKSEITTLINYFEFLFSTGSDKRLVKFNIEKERIERVYKCKEQITAIRILDNIEDKDASKILISTLYGYLELLDFDLGMISSLSVSNPNEHIISLINHSLSEFLSFSKDGQITVYDQETLNIIKEESILNLKSDDYIDLILIRSKEYILFTLEKQKMDFYTCATFKKTDSWDYYFSYDLNHCDQNYEGSKILISDCGGYITLFNFLRNADPNSKGMQLSCNRRNDPVSCLEVTNGQDQDKIISCSNDRDLRIWKKNDGLFLKKYDLSSFTNESITCMRLGKDQNMLFLGSKDMNVYLIDVGRGKLCVVYEGHWNKVNIIYTIPERDILITVSESNIKVWDLEYDECIKNMNDHESSIVHVSQYEQKSQQHILTIGANFEMRMWNYETGEDSKEHKMNVNKDGKLKNVLCACTFGQQLFLATAKNIVIYSLERNSVISEFKSYNGEQVIDIYSYKTTENQYLIVTTRTSCILYTVNYDELDCKVEKVCGYYLNAKRKISRRSQSSKYNTNFRFYFTSAKICPLKAISKTEVKKIVAGTTFTGLLDNTEGVSFDQTKDIENESKDISKRKIEENDEQNLTTRIIDTAREKIRQEVLLVLLGDSKGYLHFNHVYIQ